MGNDSDVSFMEKETASKNGRYSFQHSISGYSCTHPIIIESLIPASVFIIPLKLITRSIEDNDFGSLQIPADRTAK
jgi:hypothetical protein